VRIAYCTNVRLPSERAHGHQVAQVCDALTNLGHAVTVFATIREETIPQSFAQYYGVSDKIVLKHIGFTHHIPNWPPLRPLRLFLQNIGLKRDYKNELTKDRYDLLYTRTPALLTTLLATGIPTILELHQLPRLWRGAFVKACNRCTLVACLTSPMRDALLSWGVRPELLCAEGDGVDLRRFQHLPSVDEARTSIDLSTNRLVIGYVGRLKTLFMEKGVKHLLEALKELQSQKKFFGLVVGGPQADREEYEAMARSLGLTSDDVRFTGDVPGADVPRMLRACDVLTMPFPDFPHYRHHMSPLKMFEYMAANRPIITTDLPTIRDVLGDDSAIFCTAGDSRSLANMMRWTQEHKEEAIARAMRACALVERHTWEKRMQRILEAAKMAVHA
jgi:glycosyltransferase involved in cell wall biosynthesis